MRTSPPRVAVVTGAGRGLGLAIARQLAQGGDVHVFLTARRHAAAEKAAAELVGTGLPVTGAELDVTDPASVFRLFADVEQTHGRLDILVNNAGIAIDRGAVPSQPDIEVFQATLDTNLLGAVRCSSRAVPLMRRGGYGRITNVSSHMGSLALTEAANSPAYRISKAALNQFTRVLAAETANDGILVNAASPGTVGTRMSYGRAEYTPEQAASRLVRLSRLPVDGPTGRFFDGDTELPW
ncbi:SDR family NAD(P)-dependent oxidoreductase [Streptomyces sp. NBC_01476]|uniref:SDR family NAD(P)-dependent oxidoreductase n=1 Tax=Streptomyces sp. NBC_01476 TaxID=2903881 RepID=UPI002E375CAA|nr:SDR family NAD(P)-dependent oxidoreductase [Streptomyces sp. NBC_01476]